MPSQCIKLIARTGITVHVAILTRLKSLWGQGSVALVFRSLHQQTFDLINPLIPVLPITCPCEKPLHIPLPQVTVWIKHNCLSCPPWRLFGSRIVLLFLRTNKLIRMDFLSIFLEHFRGPRKMVFLLKLVCSKSAGNHGVLWAKYETSKVLI